VRNAATIRRPSRKFFAAGGEEHPKAQSEPLAAGCFATLNRSPCQTTTFIQESGYGEAR
jgi:hypothetical protein